VDGQEINEFTLVDRIFLENHLLPKHAKNLRIAIVLLAFVQAGII
jgi:hypothetical protein